MPILTPKITKVVTLLENIIIHNNLIAWLQLIRKLMAFFSCLHFSSLNASRFIFRSTLRSRRNSLRADFLAFFSSFDSCLFLTDNCETREAKVIVSTSSSSSSSSSLEFLNLSFSRSNCLRAAAVRPLPNTSLGMPVLPEMRMGWKECENYAISSWDLDHNECKLMRWKLVFLTLQISAYLCCGNVESTEIYTWQKFRERNILQKKFLKSWFDEWEKVNFHFPQSSSVEIAEIYVPHCVEITEIYSYPFLAKISWNQRIY